MTTSWQVCVCVCTPVHHLSIQHFSLSYNYHFPIVSVTVCVRAHRPGELARVPMPLQSGSAPSCCFHSSSESRHSQPRSLPASPPLAPARSHSLAVLIHHFIFIFLFISASSEVRAEPGTGLFVSCSCCLWHDGDVKKTTNVPDAQKRLSLKFISSPRFVLSLSLSPESRALHHCHPSSGPTEKRKCKCYF